jgi:hypothetical protein
MVSSESFPLLRVHVGLFGKLAVNLHHLPARFLYPPVVLVYFDHDFERLYQQTVAADHVPAGEVMQLVDCGASVADGTGQVPCCGLGPVMASEKLCKAHTVGIVLMATAVALVVQVERGDGIASATEEGGGTGMSSMSSSWEPLQGESCVSVMLLLLIRVNNVVVNER